MAGLENEKRSRAMSTFVHAAGQGLNADRSECRPPKMAVCGRNADPSDTATIAWQHDMIINPVGRRSGRSTFRRSR